MLKRALLLACAALAVAGSAQAALQDRDLDGDTVVDAFYDTDLDITWLRDANVNGGPLDWATAVSWADGFSLAGYTDWRLPTSDTCEGFGCTSSEMGHLYVELGGGGGSGNFQNYVHSYYWSGTEYAPDPDFAWSFQTAIGYQDHFYAKDTGLYAMAVADGDIGMVPEPGTYALMLAGLAGLTLARRRRQR
jgi:Protein of unknown function (DUF1566)/PEP-CTERM motif